MSQQNKGTDLSEIIAENFGANATYVEGLLSRFRSNADLVDEPWRAYFAELLGESAVTPQTEASDNGRATATAIAPETTPPVVTKTAAATARERKR